MTRKLRTTARILLGIYLVAVLTLCVINLSSMPEVPTTFLGIELDKVAHFLMFLPLPVLFYLSFDGKAAAIIGASILAGLTLAGTTEWIQSFLTYRSMDIDDFFADIIGLLSGAALTGIFVALRKK